VNKNSERFNCEKCEWGRHCNESNPAPFPKWEIPQINLKSKICLLPMVTAEAQEAIRLYGFYKQKILALSGGVLEQPDKYLKAMQTIERQINHE
jgi:hypothetical protein